MASETHLLLIRHLRWADARLADALHAMSGQPREAVRLFAHLAATADLYGARIRGEDPFPQDFWPDLSLEEAARLAGASGAALETLAAAPERALLRTVGYRNSAGTRFETPAGEMLLHVALHAEHHRGQIARMVREAGGEPPVTDLIVYLRQRGAE